MFGFNRDRISVSLLRTVTQSKSHSIRTKHCRCRVSSFFDRLSTSLPHLLPIASCNTFRTTAVYSQDAFWDLRCLDIVTIRIHMT